MKFFFVIFLIILINLINQIFSQNTLCLPECTGTGTNEVCIFNAKLNIYASETGYYEFDGCEGTQPTLGMKFGVKHIFNQTDETNWFHPLGFAYGPDGVYRNELELEKAQQPPGGSICDETTPCQYPQYLLNGEPLCSDEPCAADDFGLDEYEGVWFSGGRDDWLDAGDFQVEVTITDSATTELFYFCHIHNEMSGRIKVLDSSNNEIDSNNNIVIPYNYVNQSEFDQGCGTYGMDEFKNACEGQNFICPGSSGELGEFDTCMSVIDCAMQEQMRINVDSDPVSTFMRQMIPHHRNAVMMAKILLKENPASLACGTNYDGRRMQDCGDSGEDGGTPVKTLLWDIINTQNQQITFMKSWLKDNKREEDAQCDDIGSTDDDEGALNKAAAVSVSVVVTCFGTILIMMGFGYYGLLPQKKV